MGRATFTSATGRQEYACVADYGTSWKVTLKPVSPTAISELLNTPGMLRRMIELCEPEVLSSKKGEDDVEVSYVGAPPILATDPKALPMIVEGWPILLNRIAVEAMRLGKIVEQERGNSLPASAS